MSLLGFPRPKVKGYLLEGGAPFLEAILKKDITQQG